MENDQGTRGLPASGGPSEGFFGGARRCADASGGQSNAMDRSAAVEEIDGHWPGSATPLAVRQVTPLNSHPAALLGQLMDIALTCHPAADYRVRQGGRCLRRIHRTGPHVITCPVTKPRIVYVTDVSATTHSCVQSESNSHKHLQVC